MTTNKSEAQKWLKRLYRKFPLSKKEEKLVEETRRQIMKDSAVDWEKLHKPLNRMPK